ncbi:hypothetical protein I551_8832 [Mycobacterium ulcerans str. Harvey]|uniref:Uncharacterized protein n=1 Tax=Mycobacterium ulcerans str. Harvey TaxID=1299332 RepID=A0ABN0RA16_MYCUL|nr:hypothetical protein I551_8832 [Mycobacterium ulcerans str. Harvey]
MAGEPDNDNHDNHTADSGPLGVPRSPPLARGPMPVDRADTPTPRVAVIAIRIAGSNEWAHPPLWRQLH